MLLTHTIAFYSGIKLDGSRFKLHRGRFNLDGIRWCPAW